MSEILTLMTSLSFVNLRLDLLFHRKLVVVGPDGTEHTLLECLSGSRRYPRRFS